MKLTYRGVTYESNPSTLELAEGETSGKDRANNWSRQYLRHIPVAQPRIDLKYRGVAYCTGDPIDVEAALLRRNQAAAVPAIAVPTTPEVIATQSDRQQILAQLSHTHLHNIRRNLERRLEVARAKGDQNLIQLLEAEVEQIALTL